MAAILGAAMPGLKTCESHDQLIGAIGILKAHKIKEEPLLLRDSFVPVVKDGKDEADRAYVPAKDVTLMGEARVKKALHAAKQEQSQPAKAAAVIATMLDEIMPIMTLRPLYEHLTRVDARAASALKTALPTKILDFRIGNALTHVSTPQRTTPPPPATPSPPVAHLRSRFLCTARHQVWPDCRDGQAYLECMAGQHRRVNLARVSLCPFGVHC